MNRISYHERIWITALAASIFGLLMYSHTGGGVLGANPVNIAAALTGVIAGICWKDRIQQGLHKGDKHWG